MPRNSLDPDPVSDFWLDLDSMNMDRKQCVQFIIMVHVATLNQSFEAGAVKIIPKRQVWLIYIIR